MHHTNRLELGIAEKLNQWDTEAAIGAAHAIQAGQTGTPVTYPTGMKCVRFVGGGYTEVRAEVWAELVARGGKVIR